MAFEYIKQYYGVPAEFGRDVITKDMGNYIGVTFRGDKKLDSLPCHPTSEVVYLDTFTDLKSLNPKNHRSKARYEKYMETDYPGTFAEFLGIKKVDKDMSTKSDIMMGFANEINELGSFGVKGASECHNFGITWGCTPHCPVFERGECNIQEDNQKFFEDNGMID